MKSLAKISILISLLLFGSCGKENKKVTIEAPEYSTPGTPFIVPNSEEEEEDIILNPSELSKDDPCYKYLKEITVTPVATCTELENGRIKDSYKNTVYGGRLCLLRQAHATDLGIYTLVGVASVSVKDRPARNQKIDILGNGENKDQDLLKFEMKGEVKSRVNYSLSENSVTVRTVSKLWKKRYSYYRFSCKQLNPIVD